MEQRNQEPCDSIVPQLGDFRRAATEHEKQPNSEMFTMLQDNEKEDDRKNIIKAFGILKIGFTAIFSILVGFLIGLYIDSRLGTKMVFTIVFLLLGIAGGYYAAYKEVMKIIQ